MRAIHSVAKLEELKPSLPFKPAIAPHGMSHGIVCGGEREMVRRSQQQFITVFLLTPPRLRKRSVTVAR